MWNAKVTLTWPGSLVALAFVSLLAFGAAQAGDHEAREALRSELHAFAEENIFPAMDGWKARIDAQLSVEDLAALDELRAQAAEQRRTALEFRKAAHEARQNGDDAAFERNREAARDIRESMRPVLEQLKTLLEPYREQLKPLAQEAHETGKAWKEEMRAIKDNWKAEYADELAEQR